MKVSAALAALLIAIATWTARADADGDWAKVIKFDAGPSATPTSHEEAVRIAHEFFGRQQAALRAFVAAYPSDPRVLDAKLRLISIQAAEGEMDQQPEQVRQALLAFMTLERSPSTPPSRLPDVAFRRISLEMQTVQGTKDQIRDAVVTAARNYAIHFPEDKRAPRLLVEAATECDDTPDTMRDLLMTARSLSKEPALDERIADDLRRLNMLGTPVTAKFSTIQGDAIDLAALRGNVVVLIFWAAESPPSLIWLQRFCKDISHIPQDQLKIVTVSLDESRKDVDEAVQMLDLTWPINFDGKGWENAVARPLGINALPTVWILDKRGVLRTLNARDSYNYWIQRLERERY
jgi:peroxiredoxin